MHEIRKAVVPRELDFSVRYRRVYWCCGGPLPIKDYRTRKILTVFGAAPVPYPCLIICQRCTPWACFTVSSAAVLCPDRVTPELVKLSAKSGAKLPYREASDIWSTFLPDQMARKFTTLRHRTYSVGKRIEDAECSRRIATSLAEASVNSRVAKRFVKKQLMRWSRTGSHYLLKMRASMLNGDLPERTHQLPAETDGSPCVSSLLNPTPRRLKAA